MNVSVSVYVLSPPTLPLVPKFSRWTPATSGYFRLQPSFISLSVEYNPINLFITLIREWNVGSYCIFTKQTGGE